MPTEHVVDKKFTSEIATLQAKLGSQKMSVAEIDHAVYLILSGLFRYAKKKGLP